MIRFPNAKINIGLNIIEKRQDGYHNLETVFYPVTWSEPLEIVIDGKQVNLAPAVDFHSTGIPISITPSGNLCAKAYALLSEVFPLSPVKMHLHKILPIGAGLGGGSSDAACTIKMLNTLFHLDMSIETMQEYCRSLGADCAFFIENKPVFAWEKGDVFKSIELNLSEYFIALVHPPVHISTAEAYAGVVPSKPRHDLYTAVSLPLAEWRSCVSNDFETSIFKSHPQIKKIKSDLYEHGAIYASMSGSGSCVYGLFPASTDLKSSFSDCQVWEGKLN